MSLKREIRFEPGHDCIRFECVAGHDKCYPGSPHGHGIHGLQVRFLVIGPDGAVQFLLYTGWLPEPPLWDEDRNDWKSCDTMPSDLGYHSKAPRYEGQKAMQDNCEWTGGPCYYDGSSLNAMEPFKVLCSHGGDALWEYLEGYYRHTFEEADCPTIPEWPHKRRTP